MQLKSISIQCAKALRYNKKVQCLELANYPRKTEKNFTSKRHLQVYESRH